MLSIFVPADPQGQQRARWNPHSESMWSPKSAFYKAIFVEAFHVRPPVPLDGPLSLVVELIFPRPKSIPPQQHYKWTKPDVDNVMVALMNALTKAKVWADDARVCSSREIKRYVKDGETAGAIIQVTQMTDPGWRA